MQAITTKFYGPTNKSGPRIIARCDAGSVVYPYPHELGQGLEAHRAAALVLAAKMGWDERDYGRLVGGYVAKSYVFVFAGNAS